MSGLAMLGLVIGVAAVIVISSAGEGVTNSASAAISPVANSITVVSKVSPTPGGPSAKPLTDADEAALAQLPGVAELVPQVTGATVGTSGQVGLAVTASTPTRKFISASVVGTTANYLAAKQQTVGVGRFFTESEAGTGARVAVLGPLIGRALFGPNPVDALGQTVRLNHALFKVAGVLPSYGAENDNVIVMPILAARRGVFGFGYGGDQLSSIAVKATSTPVVKQTESEITELLRQRHHILDPSFDDFQVQDLGAYLTSMQQLVQLIETFVPVISAISLFVGGIGILNIMLLSVTNRIREIGTRKAVGASDGAILGQFTMEALTLAAIGGFIGIVVSVGLILFAKFVVPNLNTSRGFLSTFDPVLSTEPIVIAFGVSLLIGLAAGGYPAWRASRLEPIQALRYE
jgi:putative ABC transport system permease protein